MNRKTFALVLLLAGMILLCVLFAHIDARNVVFCAGRGGHAAVTVKLNTYEEKIYPSYSVQEDAYYFFLPSMLCGNEIWNDAFDADLVIDGRKLGKFERFEWEEGRTYTFTYGEEDVKVRFMTSAAIPAIFITTEEGHTRLLDEDKTHAERAWMDVFEADGSISYSGGLTMRGRGNSTFVSFPKKPYNIKLDKAAGILGMNRDKDWCLLANSWDYSFMNNKLALDMASAAGFRYVPDAEYADVFINGNYYGLYLVAEKAEVSEEKVSITDLEAKNQRVNPTTDMLTAETFDTGTRRGVRLENLPSDITGGYWLEMDYRLASDYDRRILTSSYFETEGYGTAFNIRSPEYADEQEVAYISGLVSELEQAVRSEDGVSDAGKSWLEYIDLTSWVRWYMVAEIANDRDKGITNTYFYKDADSVDPKFHMGPVWDYDNRFGGTAEAPDTDVLTKLAEGGWFRYLYDRPEFLEAVRQEWNTFFRDYLANEAPAKIDAWQEQIRKSVEMDNIRWYRGKGYAKDWPHEDGEFTSDYDFDEEADFLRNWIRQRLEFLDTCWAE